MLSSLLMNYSYMTNTTLFLYRWALYPPGRVPAGVTVHVNEEDGDINIETPTSLQVTRIIVCETSIL